MAQPGYHTPARRGCSTGQVPNIPAWEKTIQHERKMQLLNATGYSKSVENLYMNSKSADVLPRGSRATDETDVYKKFYSLAEFTNTLELPQSVRVVEGFSGPTKTSEISPDSILLMCFMRETKVVIGEDTTDEHYNTYSIPRDSSLFYVPLDPSYGLQGHVYNSVEEILLCKDLPKVVHIDAKTAFSLRLHSGNQLIFPARKEPNTFGKSCLICYDQKDNKFTLPATQCGSFSTKPDDIQMCMDDCIKFIRFPFQIAICDVNSLMPPGTNGSLLTLTGTKNEQSIVARAASKGEGTAANVIELPIDIPIKLQWLHTSQQRNTAEAKEVSDAYQNSTVENRFSTATTERAYKLQQLLYKNVMPQSTASEKYVTIRRQVTSSAEDAKQRRYTHREPIYENLVDYPLVPPKPPKPQRSQTLDEASYVHHAKSRQSMSLPNTIKLSVQNNKPSVAQPARKVANPHPTPSIMPGRSPQPTHSIVKPQTEQQPPPNVTNVDTPEDDQQGEEIYTTIPADEPQDDSEDYVCVMSPPLVNVEAQPHQKQLQKLEASNEELRTQLAQVTTQLKQVTAQLAQLQSSVAQILQLVVTRKPEDNIKQLSFLDTEKVLLMLQVMGLSMYEHIFREHKVDGAKMTRLDGKKLSQYGITNPQDQTKLIDVIKGSVSPLSYLLQPQTSSSSSEDNYVRFTKT